MAKPFPTDDSFLRGYYAPLNAECDAPNLQITGELPASLSGTLYRNGPNPQFALRGPYHWFSGDGMCMRSICTMARCRTAIAGCAHPSGSWNMQTAKACPAP